MYTVTCIALHSVGSRAVGTIASGFLGQLAAGVRDGITWIFTNSTDFWVRLSSPDLASEPAIGAMQRWLLPLTAAVAVGGMIAAGLRMTMTRRLNPLLDAGTGLAAIAAVGTLGVIVPDLLLRAGDAWSDWVLQASTGGAFTSRMSQLLSLGAAPDAIVVVLGIVALLLGAVQAALMLFRQSAILILAAVLPMAAAGATAPMTRAWIRKIVSWMLALICYKPTAAAVYAAAFTMIGTGTTLRTTLMGFVMIALSLVAMPILMRFFTWTTGTVASGGGVGQFLGMAATGAVAAGALRGSTGGAGGTSANEHAGYLTAQQSSPSQAANGAGAGASGSPPPPAGTGNGADAAGPAQANGPAATEAAPGDKPARAATDGSSSTGTGAAGQSQGAAVAAMPGGGSTGRADGGMATTTGAGASGGVSAGSAAASAAGPVTAAILAGQALASGARNTASKATEEGEKR